VNRSSSRGTGLGFLAFGLIWWVLSALVSLTVTGVIIYVAWHFIHKFW
jgi:divalent metal cation (Fe/Co/Zn/Cd) transporter